MFFIPSNTVCAATSRAVRPALTTGRGDRARTYPDYVAGDRTI